MSYDLLVSDADAAPRRRDDFIAWFHAQAEWSESHSYDDPAVTTPQLAAWYDEIRSNFPNMNGPGSSDDNVDNMKCTDYSIGHHVIYAAFAWSEAENAYPVVRNLAIKHGVGFYDVSGDEGDGEIMFPGDALRPASQGAWRQVAADFRSFREQD